MSRAWYHFVGDEGVTVAERQTTSRKELEQDTEGTLTKLIINTLIITGNLHFYCVTNFFE